MNVPSLPNIVDLVGLQNAVALLLLSDDRLSTVPILTEIKLHMDSDLTVDALWTLPRAAIQVTPGKLELFSAVVDYESVPIKPQAAGPIGAGLLVEMPTARCTSPNVSGPPLVWQVPVVAIEERNVNLNKEIGQFIMAEQLAQLVADILHHQDIFAFGTLRAGVNCIQRADDRENLHPGTNCWRTVLESVRGRVQTPRSQIAAITFAGGMASMVCTDPAATILFTTDGSAPVKANPGAQQYVGLIPVASGTLVQAATWRQGMVTSSINGAVAP